MSPVVRARRAKLRAWLATPVPFVWLAVGVIGGVVAGGWSLTEDRARIWHDLGRAGAFPVRYVKLDGQAQTSISAIVASIRLRDHTSLLGVDVASARENLEALPWVRHAEIRKQFPATLAVELSEAEPVARWYDGVAERLIAADGSVLDDGVLPNFRHLPLVAGTKANAHVEEAQTLLASHPFIEQRTVAAVMVGGRRWDLKLANGSTVRLPESDPDAALIRLAGLERQGALTAGDPVVIDMRIPGRTTVQLNPDVRAPEGTIESAPAADDPLAAAIAEAMPLDPLAAAIAAAAFDDEEGAI